MNVQALEAKGFTVTETDDGVRISCSQCVAACINGHPAHEHGCPNQRKARMQEERSDESE